MAKPKDASAHLLKNTVVLKPDPNKAFVFKVSLNRAALKSKSTEDALLKSAFRDAPIAARPGDYRVVAEGDSWCNLLWPFSGYPPTFVDLIDATAGYDVRNIGFPGDEFKEILAKKSYLQLIGNNTIDYLVFSGGGNDILGGKALRGFLKPRAGLGANPAPQDCLKSSVFDAALASLGQGYRQLASEVKAKSRKTKLLIHGYDHAVPRVGGKWLGTPLADRGYAPTSALSKAIIAYMVDRFYLELAAVAAEAGARIKLVNCRGACEGNWHDELHPNKKGAQKIAGRFLEMMGGAPVVVAGG